MYFDETYLNEWKNHSFEVELYLLFEPNGKDMALYVIEENFKDFSAVQ